MKTIFCNEISNKIDKFDPTMGEKRPDTTNSLINAFMPISDGSKKDGQDKSDMQLSQNLNNKTKHLESQCPACDPFMLLHSSKLRYA